MSKSNELEEVLTQLGSWIRALVTAAANLNKLDRFNYESVKAIRDCTREVALGIYLNIHVERRLEKFVEASTNVSIGYNLPAIRMFWDRCDNLSKRVIDTVDTWESVYEVTSADYTTLRRSTSDAVENLADQLRGLHSTLKTST